MTGAARGLVAMAVIAVLGGALSWLLPSLIVVAAVAGVVSAAVLKTKNPRPYEVMGRHRGDA
jgi:hypothetical protein